MKCKRIPALLLATLVVLLVGASGAWAQAPLRVGDVNSYHAETPHPYPLGRQAPSVVWTDEIISPGATFIRVHFRAFALAPGDFVTVSSPDGLEVHTYQGRGPHRNGKIWSSPIQGDTAVVRVHGGRGLGHGYLIDKVGHGTAHLNAQPEVVCGGLDGREDIFCHAGESNFDAAERPVARLLFTSGGGQFVCTGWLVDGSQSNTLVTNNHCISTQEETESLIARFNYQTSGCGGGGVISTTEYRGSTLLKTSGVNKVKNRQGLDYTLLILRTGGTIPEVAFGELIPTSVDPSVGDFIWFIQHPGGGLKKVGYYEDVVGGARCKVDAVQQTYGQSARKSQTAYACDSQGGSSGSPIVNPSNGHVIGLHHFGQVSPSTCLNSATSMSKICADAGSLLNCVGGGSGGGCEPPLLPKGSSCSSGAECCSGSCKGKPGSQTCK